jgi:hypothetical protein
LNDKDAFWQIFDLILENSTTCRRIEADIEVSRKAYKGFLQRDRAEEWVMAGTTEISSFIVQKF